jgi:hypothetical protein
MEDSDFYRRVMVRRLTGLARKPPESPQDYAWGRSLTTTASSPWYRVALPDDVYQQSVWPDLRDVRVFNHQGERVPFTLGAAGGAARTEGAGFTPFPSCRFTC